MRSFFKALLTRILSYIEALEVHFLVLFEVFLYGWADIVRARVCILRVEWEIFGIKMLKNLMGYHSLSLGNMKDPQQGIRVPEKAKPVGEIRHRSNQALTLPYLFLYGSRKIRRQKRSIDDIPNGLHDPVTQRGNACQLACSEPLVQSGPLAL